MSETHKKIGLVTGAGSGIGRACALALHQAGFRLYLVGRQKETLQKTCDLAQDGSADDLIIHPCDLTIDSDVDRLFARIADESGRLDLLFNNAGTSAPAISPDELSMDSWRKVMDINVTALFNCARQAFGLMKKQNPRGGRIINNGSISAQTPRPFSTPYTASKHAVTGLTKALSLDGREFDICCGQIDIGNAATDMTQRMNDGVLQADGELRPEPCINVKDVADAVCAMAAMPLTTNVLYFNVMANRMPFVGRG